jgi:hypothetical protein
MNPFTYLNLSRMWMPVLISDQELYYIEYNCKIKANIVLSKSRIFTLIKWV